MANPEHLELLKQGVAVWNAWWEKHLKLRPDLTDADLSGTDLSGIDLRGVYLHGSDLRNVDLGDARIHYADLRHVDLGSADLNNADLQKADLSYAHLNGSNLLNANLNMANFSHADLSRANLRFAQLRYAHLDGAHFHATRLAFTSFAGVDLRSVKALHTVIHEGPSNVDVKTVIFPKGETRTLFLRGAGFSDIFIDYLSSLLTVSIRYASCFISYAHQDEALARRLYKDLQDKGVRCWFAQEDMKIGDKIRSRIDEAIHLQEKLLLLLSEHSIASSWVENEVEAALEKEDQQQREVLFPVSLDEAVMQTSRAWAATLRRTRHIGDFTNWVQPQAYQTAFDRLLRDLKQS